MGSAYSGAYVGFDVGATTMRVVRVHTEGIDDPRKVATSRDPEEGLRVLTELIHECAGGEPLIAVAGGVPAVVSNGHMHRAPNLEGWTNFDLRSALSRALGVIVAIHNDADIAALGEATYGAGVGKRSLAYIGVGTGIGTARIVDGQIDGGEFDFEAGHQIVDVGSGRTLEELVSGGAISRRFGAHSKNVPRNEYARLTPVLSAGIYNVILHWSPEVVVLGGSVMNEKTGYRLADIVSALEKLPAIYPKLPEIKLAALSDDAGLHGARALLCDR